MRALTRCEGVRVDSPGIEQKVVRSASISGRDGVVRFLIDECLTVELARDAERVGYDAHHVAHLGKASWKDWAIRDYALHGDFILVTRVSLVLL
jgi:Domain of unknown function (DUF5615)